VMINAVEEDYLNCVIADYLGNAEHRSVVWTFNTNEIRGLIPRFAAVVLDMIQRDLIEIRDTAGGDWDDAPPMSEAELREALADPGTWMWTEGGAGRMVMLMTTDRADVLLGRNLPPGPGERSTGCSR